MTPTPRKRVSAHQEPLPQDSCQSGPGAPTEPGSQGSPPSITRFRPRSLLGNAAFSLLTNAWLAVVSFLITPFLLARLGTDHYGLYVLLLSIGGMMSLLDLGLGEATLRYVAFYHGRGDMEGINRSVGATFSVYVGTGLLSWAVLYFGARPIAGLLALPPSDLELAIQLLRLSGFNLGLVLLSGAFGSIPAALQRYDVDTALQIAQSVFQLAGTVSILLAGLGVRELVLWTIATSLFRQTINVVVAKHLLPALRLLPAPSRGGIREVFGYGIFASITRLLGLIWQEADRILLGMFAGSAAVAYLSVPKNLVLRGMSATASASAVLLPRFSATTFRTDIRRLYLSATWSSLCASIVVFVPVTVLLPDFLRLWVGADFAVQSGWIGQLIAGSCVVRGAFFPYQDLFRGLGKPHLLTAITLGSGLTNLGLNVVLISAYGLPGAGYAYLFTVVWGFSAVVYAWKRVLYGGALRPLLRAVLVPIALGYAVLAASVSLKAAMGPLGWAGLLVFGLSCLAATFALVAGVELALAGHSSHAAALLRAVGRLVRSGLRIRGKVLPGGVS